jgi:DNA/RNA-binding domain of Phe-tRNA-synthetase-like protein
MSHRIRVAPDIHDAIAIGALAFAGADVRDRDNRMDEPIRKTLQQVIHDAGIDGSLAAVRQMYRRFGIDPTKTRPSSEALLRRVRRGDPFPRVNALVDLCNWCSIETQLPFGLYDLAQIEGAIELRTGREGESYPGIRKEVVHLAGRPTLADARGPFGNPTSDSARTMVTCETTDALFVIFAPPAEPTRLQYAIDLTAARVRSFTGAIETARQLPQTT